jgi:hypothetical protein
VQLVVLVECGDSRVNEGQTVEVQAIEDTNEVVIGAW